MPTHSRSSSSSEHHHAASASVVRRQSSVQSVSEALTAAAQDFDVDGMRAGVRDIVAKVAAAEKERSGSEV